MAKPQKIAIEDILKSFTQEERVYRMRCVEAWSMVIPWIGFPLSALLDRVEPWAAPNMWRFETVVRPDEMPGGVAFSNPSTGPMSMACGWMRLAIR